VSMRDDSGEGGGKGFDSRSSGNNSIACRCLGPDSEKESALHLRRARSNKV